MSEYITTDQVVSLFGTLGIRVNRLSVYRLIHEKGLPAKKIGRSYYYRRDDVLDWIDAKK